MNFFKNKTIVVTGGSGFIGTNLILSLLKEPVKKVVCIARVPLMLVIPDKLHNFYKSGKLRLIAGDLEKSTLYSILNEFNINPDYIFHLAAVSGGIHWLKENQAKVLNTNIAILANSFQNIEKFKNLKGNLYLSSVCAYPQELQDDPENCILSDINIDKEIHNPDSSYGWSKIVGEMLVKHYNKEFNVPSVSVRMFNVYGPYEKLDENKTHVIPSLIIKAIKYPNASFDVLGDGSQVRSFLYISDAIEALKLAILKVNNGSIINVGSTKQITIKEIVSQIINVSNKKIIPMYGKNAPGVKARLPEITKIQKLGWKPKVSFKKGLLLTYKWIKDEI